MERFGEEETNQAALLAISIYFCCALVPATVKWMVITSHPCFLGVVPFCNTYRWNLIISVFGSTDLSQHKWMLIKCFNQAVCGFCLLPHAATGSRLRSSWITPGFLICSPLWKGTSQAQSPWSFSLLPANTSLLEAELGGTLPVLLAAASFWLAYVSFKHFGC